MNSLNKKKVDKRVHKPSKRLENAFNHLHRKKLSKKNKEFIEKFANSCISEGIGELRVTKYIFTLCKIAETIGKDFDEVTKEDLKEFVKELELSNYAEWTKHDYKATLKKFYKWLKGNEEEYPEEVRWIKVTIKNNKKKLPEELLTIDEVKALAEATNNLRDKAIVLTLYESGARVGEFLSLKIKHIQFDKYGALIMLHGKTGMRKVRLVASVPALSAWLNIHPFKDDKEAWLWAGLSPVNKGDKLSYQGLKNMLADLAKKAGIKKKVHPYIFRHSRATELAKNLTEAQPCQFMGWVQGSKQAATYVHLSQRDTDEAILGMYGLLEKEEGKLIAIKCPRCHQNNSPGARFCFYCGMALDIKAAMEADEREKQLGINVTQLLQDPEIAREITELLIKKAMEKQEIT